MKPSILQHVLLILVLAGASSAHGDIFAWVDAEGTRHFSNRIPPVQATGVRTFEEVPFDAQADLERREQELREQEEMAWRAIADREAALARQESLIDATYQQVQATLRRAEAVLAERQRVSSRHGVRSGRSYTSGTCYSGCTKRRYYRTRGKGYHKKRTSPERRYRYKRHRHTTYRVAKHPPRKHYRRTAGHTYRKGASQRHRRPHVSVSDKSPQRGIRGRYQTRVRPRLQDRSGRANRQAALLSMSGGGSRHPAGRMSRSGRGRGRTARP